MVIRRTRCLPLPGLAALIFLLAALLTACGGSNPFDLPTATPTSTANDATATPSPTATPLRVLYVVQAGDTLGAIAGNFGVTLEVLMQANNIVDADSIQVGDVLTIPGANVTPQPTAAASTDPDTGTPSAEVGLLQLVDKDHPLPSGFEPANIVAMPGPYAAPGYSSTISSTALPALEAMLDAANNDGYDIRVVSGYRSYADQQYTYNYWVGQLGQEQADRVSARPGYSEHQLGMTVDLGAADFGWDLTDAFGATPDGQWLDAHCTEYGFALSYPEGKEDITGYAYEPWHFRYIGADKAADFHASGLTLNQYLATQTP